MARDLPVYKQPSGQLDMITWLQCDRRCHSVCNPTTLLYQPSLHVLSDFYRNCTACVSLKREHCDEDMTQCCNIATDADLTRKYIWNSLINSLNTAVRLNCLNWSHTLPFNVYSEIFFKFSQHITRMIYWLPVCIFNAFTSKQYYAVLCLIASAF